MKITATPLVLVLFWLGTVMSSDAIDRKKHRGLRILVPALACRTAKIYLKGVAPPSKPLAAGEITTAAFPLYKEESMMVEVGKYEGYCVGLGTAADPAGGQLCTSLYFFEENGGLFGKEGDKGMISALNVYDAGETDWSVVITAGSGSYADASGEVGVKYDGKKYIMTYSVCP